jgi:hypothetical protein
MEMKARMIRFLLLVRLRVQLLPRLLLLSLLLQHWSYSLAAAAVAAALVGAGTRRCLEEDSAQGRRGRTSPS